ncbi:translation elongation factor 4 [Patescibacteria group bacterium]
MSEVRNFCIIAHIDHGKSTLADRLLEYTKTVSEREMKEQLLDQMDLERERGITIKLQPVTMNYKCQIKNDKEISNDKVQRSVEFTLNLIDTPGHVDFAYEVSRSLAACEGALLVVDATQGIQAQTLANVYMAMDQDLEIIPVINKIDLPNADPARVAKELTETLGVKEEEIILASAKTGEGVGEILQAIIKRVPEPKGQADAPLRALIFDSRYDPYRGVQAFVRVVDGQIAKNDDLHFLATKQDGEALDAGIFQPQLKSTGKLDTGAVGYVDTGLKDIEGVRVGDTVTNDKCQNKNDKKMSNGKCQIDPLPGYSEPKPVVYAGVFPIDADDYPVLKDAMGKLKLNDAALTYEAEQGGPLGFGYRCGFLGLLHLEIVQERLQREYDLNLVITSPSVVYKVKNTKGEIITVTTPAELPNEYQEILEPWARVEIITPQEYIGKVMELSENRRGKYLNTEYLGEDRAILKYEIPLFNLIVDFYDKLKSVSSGYASVNYEIFEYRPGDLVRLDILINKEPFTALSTIVHRSEAKSLGRSVTKKLKDLIPRHNFIVPIQAAVGSDIVARETISAFRKDVTAKLYGGDVTRRTKLLDKQKKGKKKMAAIGSVNVPQDVFLKVLKRE